MRRLVPEKKKDYSLPLLLDGLTMILLAQENFGKVDLNILKPRCLILGTQ